MSRRKTFSGYFNMAREKWANRFIYDEDSYTLRSKPISFVDAVAGKSFVQNAGDHLRSLPKESFFK